MLILATPGSEGASGWRIQEWLDEEDLAGAVGFSREAAKHCFLAGRVLGQYIPRPHSSLTIQSLPVCSTHQAELVQSALVSPFGTGLFSLLSRAEWRVDLEGTMGISD